MRFRLTFVAALLAAAIVATACGDGEGGTHGGDDILLTEEQAAYGRDAQEGSSSGKTAGATITPTPEGQGAVGVQETPTAEPTGQVEPGPVTITEGDFLAAVPIYAPSMQPELFVECVDNRYFPLIPGTVYHLEEQTDEGRQTVTVIVTDQTREIEGIQATVVRDIVRVDGRIIEDTRDWYAQDDRGNVWYLGEETQEHTNGQVTRAAGSWEAGVDGAVAGFIVLERPRPGDIYRQEFAPGEAEDMGAVMSLDESAQVPYGSFTNVLQTADYDPLDRQLEHKSYAPGVGLVQERTVSGSGTVELVRISHSDSQMDLDRICGRDGGVSFVGTIPARDEGQDLEQMARQTAGEARQAALSVVTDREVSSTALEIASGFLVYRVTMDDGQEVVVDAGDGAVLAVEAGCVDDPSGECRPGELEGTNGAGR